MGSKLSDPESEPHDSFEGFTEKKDVKINPPDTKEYKEYFEVKLGEVTPMAAWPSTSTMTERCCHFVRYGRTVLWRAVLISSP